MGCNCILSLNSRTRVKAKFFCFLSMLSIIYQLRYKNFKAGILDGRAASNIYLDCLLYLLYRNLFLHRLWSMVYL